MLHNAEQTQAQSMQKKNNNKKKIATKRHYNKQS